MVFESYYWKRDLLKLSRKLKKRKLLEVWNEPDYGEFEKEIMIGFYIIRKLCEACKLSNATISTKLKGRKIPSKGKIVHLLNHHRYLDFFEFSSAKDEKFDIPFLINQLIHSYIFSPYFTESDDEIYSYLKGIHFSSGKNRNKWLFEVEIDLIIDLFVKVGNDYPAAMNMYFDTNRQDYVVDSHSNSARMPKFIQEHQPDLNRDAANSSFASAGGDE